MGDSTSTYLFGNSETNVKMECICKPLKVLELLSTLVERNSADLHKKLDLYFQEETKCEVCFIMTLLEETEEVVVCSIGDTALETPIRLSVTDKMVSDVLNKKEPHNTRVSLLDNGFLDQLDPELAESDKPVLMVPVNNYEGKVSLIAGLIGVEYCDLDVAAACIRDVFRVCLSLVVNTVLREEERRIKQQCQCLLGVARRLFSQLGHLEQLLRDIMSEARTLTAAQRCSLFLLDPDQGDLVAKVFDGVDANACCKSKQAPAEVRIKRGQGIAGHVAETGRILNIRNAYEHPLFYKGLDEITGFVTKNILCFPIRDEDGIIGVAQLCNKVGGKFFDACDEEVAGAFSIYCGVSIMHSIMYKTIADAQARTTISNEMLMYHLKVSNQDVNKVTNCGNQHSHPELESLRFNVRQLPVTETPCFILHMFETLGLSKKFEIRRDTLARFTLFCQKGYRDMPYHNWSHAFAVTHFAYAAISSLKLVEEGYLTDLECLAYLVACMCHDLDHRGTNNSFEVKGGSLLASLYSSEGSVMEHHHLSQGLCILNTEGCSVLQGLSPQHYDTCLQLLRDLILATDLANHFKHMSQYDELVECGINKEKPEHHRLLLTMLMTCADLSDQIKDWPCVKNVAACVYAEFFHQGDEEKQLGMSPQEMMDREKAFIPDLQIEFLENIALPVYKILAALFPVAEPCVQVMESHVQRWGAARDVFTAAGQEGGYHLLLSPSLDIAIDKELALLNAPSEPELPSVHSEEFSYESMTMVRPVAAKVDKEPPKESLKTSATSNASKTSKADEESNQDE